MAEAEPPKMDAQLVKQAEVTTQAERTKGEPTKPPTREFNADSAKATRVKNIDDLRAQAPDVYQAMLEGIAQRIIDNMRAHQRRFKEIQRRGRER